MPAIPPVVLIATDDPATRQLFDSALAQQGASVTHADHEEQAFDKALNLMPAAVVADLVSADVNALGLRERLKGHERTRHIPILTVHGSPETWLRAVRLVSMLLLTPSPAELRRAIQGILQAEPDALPTC